MPSQFSALGFDVSSGEDLAALASHVADRAQTIDAPGGQYLKWAPPSGEQLWLQVKRSGDAMGMNPHFEGRSAVPVTLEARLGRPSHTPLDGTFIAWANPPSAGATSGDYPFAFDCPDAARFHHLTLPIPAIVQVAAFAQQISLFESLAAYSASQMAQGSSFGSRAFIPSGLVSPSGEPVDPPEAHALIAGHVLEADARMNAVTGKPFCWALIDTVGGTYDAVIDPALIERLPRPGDIVSGWFWLSGRIQTETTPQKSGWLRRLTGRWA